MKILFVKLSSLGDIVQSMPLIDLAHKKGITVDWLVEEQNSGILENHPHINKLIPVCRLKIPNILKIRKIVKRLREEQYDAVIDIQGLLKSALWTFFVKSNKKVGQKNCREGLARYVLTNALSFDGPAIERYFYLFVNGIFNKTPEYITEKITVNLAESEKESIDRLIDQDYMVLAPSSRWDSKLWPVEYWKKLIGLLSGLQIKIFIVGTKGEQKTAKAIAEGTEAIDLSGKTTHKQLFYLFDHSKLAITIDSGAMHLAAASRTKLIALFGATDPELTGPIDKSGVMRSDILCSPCLIRKCSINNKCMRLITPESVFEKAVDCLHS